MGFLKKLVKKVKKGVKKVVKGVKKVVKKIGKNKLLKTIALVGAAIVTGGAAIGAYGGSLATSSIGSALVSASNSILATPIIGAIAKPFAFAGKMIGTGAGKVTDFLGFTTEAGRANIGAGIDPFTLTDSGEMIDLEALQTAEQTAAIPTIGEAVEAADKTGFFDTATGKFVTDVAGDVLTGVGTGYALSEIQGDPENVGVYGASLGEEQGVNLSPLEIAYSDANIDIRDAYRIPVYGTGDIHGYLKNELLTQPTVGVA